MADAHVLWLRMQRPQIPPDQLRAAAQRFPGLEVLETADDAAVRPDFPRITAVFSDMPVPENLVAEMRSLRWVHTTRGGAYPYLVPSVVKRGIPVTTSTGVHGDSFGEFGMACILGWSNRLPHYSRAQQAKKWDTATRPEGIQGKTLLVLGLGTAGTAVAERAKALGMQVFATKRRMTGKPAFVDRLEPPEGLRELLPLADYVVVSLASVPSTQNVLGESELRSMRKWAFLVNLTQSRVFEMPLLVRALREEWIAGAMLHVLPQEPLPPDSELWEVPNLFIVPHTAGAARDWQSMLDIFRGNLQAFLSGGRLQHVVDPVTGY